MSKYVVISELYAGNKCPHCSGDLGGGGSQTEVLSALPEALEAARKWVAQGVKAAVHEVGPNGELTATVVCLA